MVLTFELGLLTQWNKNRQQKLKHQFLPHGQVLRCLHSSSNPSKDCPYAATIAKLKELCKTPEVDVCVKAKFGVCPRTAQWTQFKLFGLVNQNDEEYFDLRLVNTVETKPRAFAYGTEHIGYVYAVAALTTANDKYFYVGETGLEDPIKRIAAHFDPSTSCLLKRIPSDKTIQDVKHVFLHSVASSPGMFGNRTPQQQRAAAEVDLCVQMMNEYGCEKVRGAHFLKNYDTELDEHEMRLLQQYNCQTFQ